MQDAAASCAVAALQEINAPSTSPECALGDALLEAGEQEGARKAYVDVLTANPSSACGADGLAEVNSATPSPSPSFSCGEADDAFDAGDLDAARSTYRSLGDGVECAESGLVSVRDVQRLCDQGLALLESDRREDALAAFKSAIEKNPKAECAIQGLAAATPWWWPLQLISENLPEVLLLVALLIVAFFVAMMIGYFRWGQRLLARTPGIRRLMRARLTLSPLDDSSLKDTKVGAAMAARIKERLQRLREEALSAATVDPEQDEERLYELDFDSPDEDFADLVSGDSALQKSLEKLTGLSEHTKFVGGLVNLMYSLLPIRLLGVSGALHPPEKSGASVSLALESNSRMAAAITFTGPAQAADPVASDYLRLADPIAVWAQYVVSRVLAGNRVDADSAESYAMVRRGLDAQLDGNYEEARSAYERALELNPRNAAAKVNLAMVQARLASRFELATQILAEALLDLMTRRPVR